MTILSFTWVVWVYAIYMAIMLLTILLLGVSESVARAEGDVDRLAWVLQRRRTHRWRMSLASVWFWLLLVYRDCQ